MKHLKYLLIVFMLLVLSSPALADDPEFDFDGFDASVEPATEETEATVSGASLESENFDFDGFDASVEEAIEAAEIGSKQNQCTTMVGSGSSKGSYEVCFKGVDYNDNTSTWTYSITNNGAQELSHWTLNLCKAPVAPLDSYLTIGSYGDTTGRADVSYPVSWGQDKTTFGQGVPVFKYDSGMDDGETDIFQFVMDGRYDTLSDLKIATKSGQQTGTAFGEITGPDCNTTTTPPPPPITTSCVTTANTDRYGRGGGHAIYMPRIAGTQFVFEPAGRFVENSEDGTATLTGKIYRRGTVRGDSEGFDVVVNFRNRTNEVMSGSPKKELKNNPYDDLVNTTTWYYYQDFSGTFTGLPGGKYEGAELQVGRRGPNYQVGIGANGKNIGYGASSWMTWQVTQQPNQGSLKNGNGDFNFDIGNCDDTGVSSLGDFVWRDTNKNGIQDEGEKGIGDVVVQLFNADTDNLFDTDITDADGRYLFDNLPAGNYFVRLPASNFADTGRLAGFEISPLDADRDNAVDSDGQGKTVFEEINVAQGKSATQSSTHSSANASRAVDGDTNGRYGNSSVSHTSKEKNAWWEVDLGQVYDLTTIKIWNRTDCCSNRLSNFYIFVSDNPFTSEDIDITKNQTGVSATEFSGTAGRETKANVNRSGRYIRVQLAGNGKSYLQLAEVQAFIENGISTGKIAQTVDINLPINTDDMTWDFGVYEGQATAITLDYFNTAVNGQEVTLNWATATEVDNAGFNIYRATSADGEYSRINDVLITAKGTVYGGATYSLIDTPGEGEFFYILEDIDYYNQATSYEPVSANIAATLRPAFRPTQPDDVDR